MELAELEKHWDAFGAQDPLWAIMTVPGKRYGRWDVDDFFETGRQLVSSQMKTFEQRGIELNRGRVLDFGCGVGRLTQALGDTFQECDGVDISRAMIERAREYNRHGRRCRYHLNIRDDLSLFADNTFDLVYTNIVLQHMQPKYALRYIEEFLRVLVPGGMAFYQMPAGPEPARSEPSRPRTMNREPLPETGYRARIQPIELPPTFRAGSPLEVVVRVTNLGDVVWRATGAEQYRLWIGLGNHWLDEQRRLINHDDGRIGLPWDVGPGEDVDLRMTVTAPSAPGRYLLEIDMVQEYVSWFKEKGSQTLLAPVEVLAPSAQDDFRPQMQMHSIEKDHMIAFLNERGGKVVAVERINEGQGLLDYNYYVTK